VEHGVHGYFIERARSARRVSLLTLVLALLGLTLIGFARSPAGQNLLRETKLLRFGYEGPEQYVRRIELKSMPGVVSEQEGLQSVYVPATRRGGTPTSSRTLDPSAPPATRPVRSELGEADVNLTARMRAARDNVPLVQSEDLIIEHLVRPVYPEEAREQELEGKVAILALVDTLGQVARVEVMAGDASGLLEQAAVEAVWKCRFKPYIVEGEAPSVYAMFRFSFRIY
jgi:TonB family protein